MAKKGLELKDLSSLVKERCKTSGWALCVGAGVSVPAFPSWNTLTEHLAARDVGSVNAAKLISVLAGEFSYDALIQAAKDRLGYDDGKFAKILTVELYSNIRSTLNRTEWKVFTKVLSSIRVSDIEARDRKSFLDIVRKYFKNMSGLLIAEIISDIVETNLAPSAILSFNAEPLLLTLIKAFTAERIAPSKREVIDVVTHGISNRRANRIPYYFCHGLLPVPAARTSNQTAQSIDKLVFSETNYLQLSNSTFSWQSSVFIDICSSKSVVFIGVSLSDSNMRRWLSWIYDNRVQELRVHHAYKGVSTSHLWINKLPASSAERDWIESSVAHLGVRLIWIKSWSEVGQALNLLLGK